MTIKFGTSGWRDVIAQGFTFGGVRTVAQAIAEQIRKEKLHNRSMLVGYDTRFLSENFAREVASIFSANGLEVHLTSRDAPTPVLAFEIIRSRAAGAVNITASHNPWDYSGLKYSSAWGGPALPATTAAIEEICRAIEVGEVQIRRPKDEALASRLIQPMDPRPAYLKYVRGLLDVKAIKKAGLSVVVDSLYGTGREYLDTLLEECGCKVTVLHNWRDVLFGGTGPDPSPHNLKELVSKVQSSRARLGLATDGDADRFGIVDADGGFISPNDFLALMVHHLHVTRGWTGVVARSVMTTHFIDAVGKKYGLITQETPVGFKYIGEIMAKENAVYPSKNGNFLLGGEESGGFTMRGHVPEKDGILACLLAAEMVATHKSPLRKIMADLQKETGPFLSERFNYPTDPVTVGNLKETLSKNFPTQLAGVQVRRIVDIDGHKFVMTDGSWLGLRPSGTEPMIRVYVEASNPKRLQALAQAGRDLIDSCRPSKSKKPTAKSKKSLIRAR
jgi:phosphoglucomutase